MHEISIAENLSVIVLEAAGREKLSRVTRINICFGQLVQVVPAIFEFAFRETVRGSVAQDAELSLEIIPVKLKCKMCSSEFSIKENFFVCGNCGSTDLTLIQGKELFVTSIEGE